MIVNTDNDIQEQMVNIISAEQDSVFHRLDVDNIVVELPKNPSQGKGVWVNIKYKYQDGKVDKLRIQTSELFSFGVSKYEESSPPKMCFSMTNKKQRESLANGEDLSEEEKMNISVEDGTIDILDKICEKVRNAMKDSEMIKALGKGRDKKWVSKVDGMEIVKRKENDNGIESAYVYAKIVTDANFMKTRFYQKEEEGVTELNSQETIDKLSKKGTNCKVIANIVVDSVFVGKDPHIQVKLSEAVINEYVEFGSKCSIVMPKRSRGKKETSAQRLKICDSG